MIAVTEGGLFPHRCHWRETDPEHDPSRCRTCQGHPPGEAHRRLLAEFEPEPEPLWEGA